MVIWVLWYFLFPPLFFFYFLWFFRCTGLNDADFEFGSCEEKDPCAGNPCGEGKACVPDKRVCLSLLHSPCPQNQCGESSTKTTILNNYILWCTILEDSIALCTSFRSLKLTFKNPNNKNRNSKNWYYCYKVLFLQSTNFQFKAFFKQL